jgi:hypothetical protein
MSLLTSHTAADMTTPQIRRRFFLLHAYPCVVRPQVPALPSTCTNDAAHIAASAARRRLRRWKASGIVGLFIRRYVLVARVSTHEADKLRPLSRH